MRYYKNNAKDYIENTVTVDMSKLYSDFLEYMPSNGKILDVGCGSGRDTKAFIDIGYEVTAIDPVEEFVKYSSEYNGQKTLLMKVEEIKFEDEFYGIWACASLLHLEFKDMHMVLGKLYRALKKDGVLFISVKYGIFEGIRNDRFFCDYTEEKFEKTGYREIGFELIKYDYNNDMRPGKEDEKWLNIYLRK